MNLTLMNVAMRKFGRAVRLPDATVPSANGSGLSKSAVSRRFVALTQQKLTDWMSSDLSKLDLVVIQIDGMHLDENLLMIGAVVEPMGNAPVHTPMANARRLSGQPTSATATDDGTTSAPPTPCSARPAIRIATLGASTHTMEATAKIAPPI